MSLLDALLLDPPPLTTWSAPLSVTLTNNGAVATATTSVPHGYSAGDIVIISGAAGASASLWNGRFSIYGVASNSFSYTMLGTPSASAAGSPAVSKQLASSVWISLRTDGVAGSGTQSDPYDGSMRASPPISISSLTSPASPGDQQAATVTTAVPHGFAEGDVVTIAGVTGSGAATWNGTFPIYNATANIYQFQYYLQAVPADVVSGSPTASKLTFLFDSLMSLMPANTTVHLGAGVFPTRGRAGAYYAAGWTPKSGQKILGSGMEVTFLKVVYASAVDNLFLAIGGDYNTFLQSFEASDFTVDCNLGGQLVLAGQTTSKLFPQMACGAIQAFGRDIRIRRIRAINFGTQTSNNECFVLSSGGAHPDLEQAVPPQLVVDCVIENCLLEKPSLNNVRETTYIIVPGGARPTTGEEAYHRGCAVRNCFINAEFQDNPVAISSMSFSGTTATVTTRAPHGRANGDWVRVSGALENGVTSTNFNGSFPITYDSATTFHYTMPGTPAIAPTGEMWVGRWSSYPVPVDSNLNSSGLHNISLYAAPRTYKITTVTPHFRTQNNNILVFNVSVAGFDLANAFNGGFKIDAILSPTELTYTLLRDPEGPIDWPNSYVFIGTAHQAISPDGGTGTVVEGNRVYNCAVGYYHDTGSTKDVVIRNNHFYRVNVGVFQTSGGFGSTYPGAQSTSTQPNPTRGGPGNTTATFRTAQAHGFLPGQGVNITNAPVAGSLVNAYNGLFVITSVSSTLFTYVMNSDPGANGDVGSTPRFAAKWQVRRMVIENNLIELGLNVHPQGYGPPTGISLYAGNFAPVYTFPQAVFRSNVIRQADNAVDTVNGSRGISLYSCGNAIIEDNTIDLNPLYRIIFFNSSATPECFDNTTPAGVLIQAYNYDTQTTVDELTTNIEDTLCISI